MFVSSIMALTASCSAHSVGWASALGGTTVGIRDDPQRYYRTSTDVRIMYFPAPVSRVEYRVGGPKVQLDLLGRGLSNEVVVVGSESGEADIVD